MGSLFSKKNRHPETLPGKNQVFDSRSLQPRRLFHELPTSRATDVSIQDHKKHLEDKFTRLTERDKLSEVRISIILNAH
jgi:hypothetical protein